MRFIPTLILASAATMAAATGDSMFSAADDMEMDSFIDRITQDKNAPSPSHAARAFAPDANEHSDNDAGSSSPTPSSSERVLMQVVTETVTECGCKATPTSEPARVQGPSQGSALIHGMQTSMAMATPSVVASSSKLFGPMGSATSMATPLPSGADALSHGGNDVFTGGAAGQMAPKALAALGVSAVMAVMVL